MKQPACAAATAAVLSLLSIAGFITPVSCDFIALPVLAQAPSLLAQLSRRATNPISATISNQQTYYAINVAIGTPPQQVSIILDTGSSELWVDPNCRTAPYPSQQQCRAAGIYDPTLSTTPPTGPFGQSIIKYGDPTDTSTQTSASLVYYSDVVQISGATVTNQTFGVVSQSQGIAQGILGLGPDLAAGFSPGQPYSYLLNTLAAQGAIASRVFSLDLRSSSAQAGALIFGGLDRGMFAGPLMSAPLVRGLQNEYRLAAEITSVTITLSTTQASTFQLAYSAANRACLLDSGSSLTRLQPALALQIVSTLRGVDDGSGYFAVDCALMKAGAFITFSFSGGGAVNVPMSEFLFDNGPSEEFGPDVCYIAMAQTTDLQVLGDSVLRAGYFVFDWDNSKVHIAQAASCANSNIVAVSSGPNAVPSVTGQCQAGVQPQLFPSAVPSVTSSYTSIVTISSCSSTDPHCQTGVMTQTGVAVLPSPTPSNDASLPQIRWDTGGLLPLIAAALAII